MSDYRSNRPFIHVHATERERAGHTLSLSLRRILTQFCFELELTDDPAEIDVLSRLKRAFLLNAELYRITRGILPFELEFDYFLLVPYADMLPGRMSEEDLQGLRRDSPLQPEEGTPSPEARRRLMAAVMEYDASIQAVRPPSVQSSFRGLFPQAGTIEPAIDVLATTATQAPALPVNPSLHTVLRRNPPRDIRPTIGEDFIMTQPRLARAPEFTIDHHSSSTPPMPTFQPPDQRVQSTTSSTIRAFPAPVQSTELRSLPGREGTVLQEQSPKAKKRS